MTREPWRATAELREASIFAGTMNARKSAVLFDSAAPGSSVESPASPAASLKVWRFFMGAWLVAPWASLDTDSKTRKTKPQVDPGELLIAAKGEKEAMDALFKPKR
jgi:hypothetical protein